MQFWSRSRFRSNPLSALVRLLTSVIVLLLLGPRARLPQDVGRQESHALDDTGDTRLGSAAWSSAAEHPDKSGFHLLPQGVDAFVARAMLAISAERSIDAQYYLLHNDLVGTLFIGLLLDAADRGVRVRLLVDDMALDDAKDIGALQLDAHANVEVRVFNPFGRNLSRWIQYLSRFGDVTRRMHNKSFTVDNGVTVIGGRNIGNEYFDADPNLLFGDLDVLAVGPVVEAVSTMFDLYWNSDISYPVASLVRHEATASDLAGARKNLDAFFRAHQQSSYLQGLRENPLIDLIYDWSFEFEWGGARVLYDHPDKIRAARDQHHLKLTTQLRSHTARVEQELCIISPYFVPGRDGVEMLLDLRRRGVRVRVLTNSLASTDVSVVHAGYARYRRRLLRGGVELYELDNTLSRQERRERKGPYKSSRGSLHVKSFIHDRKQVFIGSMNFDPRSLVENTEIGVLIDSTDMALEIGKWFDLIATRGAFRLELEAGRSGGEKIVWYRETDDGVTLHSTEPNSGWWRRFGNLMLRLIPLESQL